MSVIIDDPFDGTGPLTAPPWTAHPELTWEDGSDATAELTDTDQVSGKLNVTGGNSQVLLEHDDPLPLNCWAEVTYDYDVNTDPPAWVSLFLRAEESVAESPDLNAIEVLITPSGTDFQVRTYELIDRSASLLDDSTVTLSAGPQQITVRAEVNATTVSIYVNDTLVSSFDYTEAALDTNARVFFRVYDDLGHVTGVRGGSLPFDGVSEFWTDFRNTVETPE